MGENMTRSDTCLTAPLSRSLAALAVLAVLALGGSQTAQAAEVAEATSSNEARLDAMRSLPLAEFDENDKAKVSAVLSGLTMFRRMPTQVIRCEPGLYKFMIEHPDVTVNMWEVMGISKVALQRTGRNTFKADDGAGTKADIEFLYRSPEKQVIYAVGSYHGPLFSKPVYGGCLMVLRSGYFDDPEGDRYVTSRLDAFFRLDHAGVELLAKTFKPMVAKAADYNFVETLAFLGSLSRTAELRPELLQKITPKLTKVRDEDRAGFEQVVVQTAANALPRLSRQPEEPQEGDTEDSGEPLIRTSSTETLPPPKFIRNREPQLRR